MRYLFRPSVFNQTVILDLLSTSQQALGPQACQQCKGLPCQTPLLSLVGHCWQNHMKKTKQKQKRGFAMGRAGEVASRWLKAFNYLPLCSENWISE